MELATWLQLDHPWRVSKTRFCRTCKLPFMYRETESGTFGLCPQCDDPVPLVPVKK